MRKIIIEVPEKCSTNGKKICKCLSDNNQFDMCICMAFGQIKDNDERLPDCIAAEVKEEKENTNDNNKQ